MRKGRSNSRAKSRNTSAAKKKVNNHLLKSEIRVSNNNRMMNYHNRNLNLLDKNPPIRNKEEVRAKLTIKLFMKKVLTLLGLIPVM